MEALALGISVQHVLCRNSVPPFVGSVEPWRTRVSYTCHVCCATTINKEPFRRQPSKFDSGRATRPHSKQYLARQSAILEVQQSSDVESALTRLGGSLKVQDLNAIIRYFGIQKRWHDLSQLFEWMQQSGKISASSYSSYIKFMGKSLNPVKALEIYIGIQDEPTKKNVHVCNLVLGSLVRSGKFDGSIKLFHQMKQDGLTPDVVTYSTLLAGCIKFKHGYSRALELVQELQNNELQMDSVLYGTLLSICASNNKLEEAESYFKQMKDEGHLPNEFHYSSLLNAYSGNGNYKKADALVQDMKSAGEYFKWPYHVILRTLTRRIYFFSYYSGCQDKVILWIHLQKTCY